MNGQGTMRDERNDAIDLIALGGCLHLCNPDKKEQQAFLTAFEHADNRARYRMLLRERQMLLRIIHEKEEALEQLDYMMHLLAHA